MAFSYTLFCCLAIATVVKSASLSQRSHIETPLDEPAYEDDSYQVERKPSLNLELPRFDAAPIPFYSSEPSTDLRAPVFADNSQPNFYQVPIPAQELVAPIETVWNPNDDPKFYYDVPAVLTKQETPTNSFPKKYNKDIHSKDKPFSSKPKQEFVLEPIEEVVYGQKQKELHNVFQKLAKKENQKQIEVEKVLSEPKAEATGFSSGFDSEGVTHHQSSDGFTQGLSADLTSSLGIPGSHASASNQERLVFHMVGHDGPHSYKWGYDTGKGHNRQFRYEERDKEGSVKGHFGFYDKHGKLQMVNYDSHPHEGFHAEGNFGKF